MLTSRQLAYAEPCSDTDVTLKFCGIFITMINNVRMKTLHISTLGIIFRQQINLLIPESAKMLYMVFATTISSQVKSSQVAFIEIVAIALSYNGIKNTVQ